MKIKIERNQKEKTPKKKKERIVSVGKHRKMVLALWFLLSCSLAFGIYKNFTTIDQHTTHEKVVVKEKIVNTSGIESFTKDFAKEYYSWKNNKEVIEKRMSTLGQYLTEEGLALSQDMVRADIPTSSDYRVTIFEDEKGNHIVTSLPTMIAKPDKAKYEAKQVESDPEIDAKTTEEITEFLETFFKLYPTASEKELEYYVEDDAMRPINVNLKFVELADSVFFQDGNNIQAKINVKYLDDLSKTTNFFQYRLSFQKKENWTIVGFK
ncbi:conjugal transfer protein [Enterococcus faecium]